MAGVGINTNEVFEQINTEEVPNKINTEEVFNKINAENGEDYQAIFGITFDGRVVAFKNRGYIQYESEYEHIFTVQRYSRKFVPKFLSADNFMETMEKVRKNNTRTIPTIPTIADNLVDDLPPLV